MAVERFVGTTICLMLTSRAAVDRVNSFNTERGKTPKQWFTQKDISE
jgi:hypothetical protein